MKNPHFLQLG